MLLPSLPLSSLPFLLLLPLLPTSSYASSNSRPATVINALPPSTLPPSSPFDQFKSYANGALYAATGIDLGSLAANASKGMEYDALEDERDGIVRIDDENWERIVELEDLPEGVKEEDRVWCILIHGPKSDLLTHSFYNAHAIAANTTKALAANNSDPLDMKHVSFARVSYLDVTELTTRWLIFKPPYFVFASNRGSELRFLSPRSVRPEGNLLRGVLSKGGWKDAPIWQSRFAPGGSWETPLRYIGSGLAIFYERTKNIPRFAWLILSGVITQQMMSWMHSAPLKKPEVSPSTATTTTLHPAGSEKARAVADAVRRRAAVPKSDGSGARRGD